MNKRTILVFAFFFSFLIYSNIAFAIDKKIDDPANDIIVVQNFQYTFDLNSASIEDLEIIQNIEYYHTSEKPGLDLSMVDIDNQGDNTQITFEVEQIIENYPYTGRNTFFIGIIILEDDNNGMGAIHIEQSLLEFNRYGAYYSNELSEIQEFEYTHDENEFIFSIPKEVFPDIVKEIYAIIGEADISDLNLETIQFTISNIRIDLYPNSLYGANSTDYPENEDIEDVTSSDSDSINPYLISIVGVIAVISIITIPSLFKNKS